MISFQEFHQYDALGLAELVKKGEVDLPGYVRLPSSVPRPPIE